MLFARVKQIRGLYRLRLRGPNGTRDEFNLAATVQNLPIMAKLLPAAVIASHQVPFTDCFCCAVMHCFK